MLRIFTQSLKVVTVVALAVVVLAAGAWAFSYASELVRPSDIGEAVMVTVFEDQTDDQIAQELVDQGLIRSSSRDSCGSPAVRWCRAPTPCAKG